MKKIIFKNEKTKYKINLLIIYSITFKSKNSILKTNPKSTTQWIK